MFITNIRYGSRPAKKLYIGEKLVWQCITARTNTNVDLNLKEAIVYIPVVRSISSSIETTMNIESALNAIEVSLMMSEEEVVYYNKTTINVPQLLSLTGIYESKSNTASLCNTIIHIVLEGVSESTLNLFVRAGAFDSLPLESNVVGLNNENTVMGAGISLRIGGTATSNTNDESSIITNTPIVSSGIDLDISSAEAQMILWYPPEIVDGVMEIRQAYQVITDDENGTMEVI